MNSKKEYQYIGKSEYNVNATAKATGRAKYCSDMQLPGMLYAKVKRSPYPHARIVSIDTSKAEQLPGVKVVIVGDEKTCPFRFGAGVADEYVLARDKVRYVGDAGSGGGSRKRANRPGGGGSHRSGIRGTAGRLRW